LIGAASNIIIFQSVKKRKEKIFGFFEFVLIGKDSLQDCLKQKF